MNKFDEVYNNLKSLLTEGKDFEMPGEDKFNEYKKLGDYSVSWKYHSKSNNFDHGHIDKLSHDRFFNMKRWDSLEDFINDRFPEKVSNDAGEYYYVEVKDKNGNVVYRRGDEMGVGLL